VDREFESRWGHGCSSLVFVVKVAISATSWSLIQRVLMGVYVYLSVCDLVNWTLRRPRPELSCCAWKKVCRRTSYKFPHYETVVTNLSLLSFTHKHSHIILKHHPSMFLRYTNIAHHVLHCLEVYVT
jgi:hypothetical protein